ncbi:SDR family NAD(P)-dependent oxidoreductase [Nocardia sp. NPDC050789]
MRTATWQLIERPSQACIRNPPPPARPPPAAGTPGGGIRGRRAPPGNPLAELAAPSPQSSRGHHGKDSDPHERGPAGPPQPGNLPRPAAYTSAKAAAVALSESLHDELAPHGIDVSVVCPPYFRTGLSSSLRDDDSQMASVARRVDRQGRTRRRADRRGRGRRDRHTAIADPHRHGRAVLERAIDWSALTPAAQLGRSEGSEALMPSSRPGTSAPPAEQPR